MDTDVVQAVARYAEEILGSEGFRYACTVVANCKMLAVQLETEEEDGGGDGGGDVEEGGEGHAPAIAIDALVIAGYLHDISTVAYGYTDHQIKSAEMAVDFLRGHGVPDEQIRIVEQAILTHRTVMPEEQRGKNISEGQILYDADKLGRLSGLAVVTSLIEFGARYANQAVTGDVLASILRHVEERFIDLYQSLNTAPAREMAHDKFNQTLAFLDGVIEHLSDATPV